MARPENVPRIEFISKHKSLKFDEIIKEKLLKTQPNVFKDTQKAIKEHEKVMKEQGGGWTKLQPVEISKHHPDYEEPDKMKFFIGETILHHKSMDRAKINQKQEKNMVDKLKKKHHQMHEKQEKLTEEKHDVHSAATQETQLVGIQKNKETLEGKVDLDKVREIRRALRRRYANRKNIQKIFSSWDEQGNGVIDVSNVFNMIKKLGININIDEARVLVASANSDPEFGTTLNMQEFIEMIFTDNEKLMDLKHVPQMTKAEIDEMMAKDDLSKGMKNTHILRHDNQLKQIMKNKIQNLITFIKNEDHSQQEFINFERLERVIRKSGISETIMKKDDIKNLFDQYKLDDYKFDYQKFLKELNDFKFVPEHIYEEEQKQKMSSKQLTQQQKFLQMFNKLEAEQGTLNVFEINKVDANHLERIKRDSKKVINTLQRYFPNKSDFDNYLMGQMNISAEKYQKSYISKESLIANLKNIMLNFEENYLKNSEIEGFLSSIQYNKMNSAKVKDLTEIIYDIDEKDWDIRMQQKLMNPPPPKGDSQLSLIVDQEQLTNNPQSWYARDSGRRHFDARVVKILEKFENQIFCGTKKAYDVYKQFDVDQDGYINHQDLVNQCEKINFLDKNEIAVLFKYLDPEQKGYVDFAEFSSKIRAGCLDNDEMGKQAVVPYIFPDKQLSDDKQISLPLLTECKNNLRKSLNLATSDHRKDYKCTRFGATPSFKNTFTNFVPQNGSGMFMNDQDRFDRSHNHRLKYLYDEKASMSVRNIARIETKKEWNDRIEEKVQQEFKTIDSKDEDKRKTQGLKKWSYEHRCHLKNEWQ